MDAFLRRVMEQRELEQEVAIIATPLDTFVRRCRLCGRRISGDTGFEIRVCLQCGGKRMHFKLLKQDALAFAHQRHRDELLRCAGFQPQPLTQEPAMSDRKCTNCSKQLRSNNQHETCSECRKTGAATAEGDGGGQTASRPPTRKAKTDAQKRFKVVASALGVDPDNLIAEFCEGWLARIRTSANFGTDA